MNSFTIDGRTSTEWGIGISAGSAWDAPARRGEKYSVPGRNGDIWVDGSAYENAILNYPCWIAEGFNLEVDDFRDFIARHGDAYYRLTDTYHPDEYRMARYAGGFEAEPGTRNLTGRFGVSFDCDPRRFLLSGETEEELTTSITNPTRFIAYPLIRIQTMNVGTITFGNGNTFRVTGGNAIQNVVVDGETLLITSNGSPVYLANVEISGKLGLVPGANEITETASQADTFKAYITPRWYTI